MVACFAAHPTPASPPPPPWSRYPLPSSCGLGFRVLRPPPPPPPLAVRWLSGLGLRVFDIQDLGLFLGCFWVSGFGFLGS